LIYTILLIYIKNVNKSNAIGYPIYSWVLNKKEKKRKKTKKKKKRYTREWVGPQQAPQGVIELITFSSDAPKISSSNKLSRRVI
jgi:hypothetical protein